MGNKLKTYDLLMNIESNFFKIPRHSTTVKYFPCIIKTIDSSHDTRETICHNEEELIKEKKIFNNEEVISVEYIDSYNIELQMYCSLRLMVVNKQLIDYFFRPSKQWNIHTKDQDKKSILKADKYFHNFYIKDILKIDKLLEDLHKIYGNGFFSYDLILNNDILYLCETGLKYYDNAYHNFIKKKSIDLNKNNCDLIKLKKLYNKILIL